MKMIVNFLVYDDEDLSIDWSSGKVELLGYKDIYVCDEICSEVEVLVDEADLKEIQKESRGLDGFFHTYEADRTESYKDGKETKYAVMAWNLVD